MDAGAHPQIDDGRRLEAVGEWAAAVALYRQLATDEKPRTAIFARIRAARCLLETARWNETHEAEGFLREAKRSIEQHALTDDAELNGQYLLQRGRLDDHLGHLKRALDRYEGAYKSLSDAGAGLTEAELVLASAERRRGELQKALERLDTINPDVLDPRETADYFDERGAVLLARGETRPAIEVLEHALRLDEDTGSGSSSGRSLLLLAEAYMRAGEVDDSKRLIMQATRMYEAEGATGPLSEAYALMGTWHEDREDFAGAADCYRRSFDLDSTSEDQHGQARAKRRLARIFRKRGDSSRARELIEDARDLLPPGDDVARAALLQEEAELYLSGAEPDYLKAISLLEEAREIATEDGDERVIAIAKRNLARAYREDDQLGKALEYLEEAKLALASRGDLRELDDLLDDVGEVLIEDGRYEEALISLRESLDLDERLGRVSSKGRTLILLGRAIGPLGDATTAADYFKQAERLFEDAHQDVGLAEALYWQADWHLEQRQLRSAIPVLQRVIEIENRLNRSPTARVRAKRLLAQAYRERGDLRRAHEYLEEARHTLGPIDDPDEQAWINLEEGRLAFAEGRFREAGDLLRTARKTLRTSGSAVDVARCDRFLGLNEAYQGRYHEAVEFLVEARTVLKEQTDVQELDELHDDFGEVYLLMRRYDDARESVLQSIEVGDLAGWRHGKGRSLLLLAKISQALGETEEARRNLVAAIDAYTELDDNVGKADALLAMGDWFQESRDYDEAAIRYKEARRLEHAHQDLRGVSRCTRRLASVYISRHEYDRAQEALEDASEIMMEIHDVRELALLEFELGRLAAARHEYSEAGSRLRGAVRAFKGLGLDDERRAAAHLLISCYQAQGMTDDALEAIRDLESERAAMYSVLVKDLHPLIAAAGEPSFKAGRYGEAIVTSFRELETRIKNHGANVNSGVDASEPIAVHIKALAQISHADEFGLPHGNSLQRFWDLCSGSFALLRNRAQHEGLEYAPADAFAALSVAHLIARTLDQRLDPTSPPEQQP